MNFTQEGLMAHLRERGHLLRDSPSGGASTPADRDFLRGQAAAWDHAALTVGKHPVAGPLQSHHLETFRHMLEERDPLVWGQAEDFEDQIMGFHRGLHEVQEELARLGRLKDEVKPPTLLQRLKKGWIVP